MLSVGVCRQREKRSSCQLVYCFQVQLENIVLNGKQNLGSLLSFSPWHAFVMNMDYGLFSIRRIFSQKIKKAIRRILEQWRGRAFEVGLHKS